MHNSWGFMSMTSFEKKSCNLPFFCLPPVIQSRLNYVTKELCLIWFEDREIDCIHEEQTPRRCSREDLSLKNHRGFFVIVGGHSLLS